MSIDDTTIITGKNRKSGKGSRKHGRMLKKPSHKRYNSERRWIKNKAKRIAKHLKTHPRYKPYNLDPDIRDVVNSILKKRKQELHV